jgi:alpha-1,2-mannosyltransferase
VQSALETSGRACLSDAKLFALVLIPVFAVFLATADRSIPYHIDPFTNVLTASSIANNGSPILAGYDDLSEPDRFARFGWVIDSPRGPVSQYPPGTALLAAPLYLLASDTALTLDIYAYNDPTAEPIELEVPALWPAALIASLTSSLAVAFTALSVRDATSSTGWAAATAILLAAGTGLWLNGAYQLWQHGPASMWIAAAVWAASRARWLGSGLLAGVAVLTRPPVAFISAGIGIFAALKARSWAPLVKHGAGALVGTGALLAFNYWLFGTITISGGYGSTFSDNLLTADTWWYARNLAGGFFSIDRGVFVWTPILAIATMGLPKAWRQAPGWAVGALVGGTVLLLIQFRLNRYSGGDGFFSYRYPLEAIVAATPLLAVGAKRLWDGASALRLLLPLAAVASVGFHLLAFLREVG